MRITNLFSMIFFVLLLQLSFANEKSDSYEEGDYFIGYQQYDFVNEQNNGNATKEQRKRLYDFYKTDFGNKPLKNLIISSMKAKLPPFIQTVDYKFYKVVNDENKPIFIVVEKVDIVVNTVMTIYLANNYIMTSVSAAKVGKIDLEETVLDPVYQKALNKYGIFITKKEIQNLTEIL